MVDHGCEPRSWCATGQGGAGGRTQGRRDWLRYAEGCSGHWRARQLQADAHRALSSSLESNMQVYGVPKFWKKMNREGIAEVANKQAFLRIHMKFAPEPKTSASPSAKTAARLQQNPEAGLYPKSAVQDLAPARPTSICRPPSQVWPVSRHCDSLRFPSPRWSRSL